MKTLLLSLLLLAAPSLATTTFDIKYEMWFEVCDRAEYSCIGVIPPEIAFQPDLGPLGTYEGGELIYVRSGQNEWVVREVVLHEMVHYLQHKVGGISIPGRAYPICKAEETAFKIVDGWLEEVGRGSRARGVDWWMSYNHCKKWYDPDWKPIIRFPWGGIWLK